MKRIPNFSNYSVTKDGRVYSHRLRAGFVTAFSDKNGYVRFNIEGDNGKRKGMYAHQLVALTYIPNPDNKPEVNHLDHNKANNHVSNLRWCTHQENVQYDWAKGKRKKMYGRGKINPQIARQIRKLHQEGELQINLAETFGISQATVSQITRKFTWSNI